MFFFLQFCRLTVPAQDFQDNGQIASLRSVAKLGKGIEIAELEL